MEHSQQQNRANGSSDQRALRFAETHGTVLLLGEVGSQAYGLADSHSDRDYLAVVAIPTDTLLGLSERSGKQSWANTAPDIVAHELAKFARQALACNPTITELLWLERYNETTPEGLTLVENRAAFLSAPRVRAAYAGYVKSQATRLLARARSGKTGFDAGESNRVAKHGRHCARLLLQGQTLLQTGKLSVDVALQRKEIENAGQQAAVQPEEFAAWVYKRADELEHLSTCLPGRPDTDLVESTVISIRRALDQQRR